MGFSMMTDMDVATPVVDPTETFHELLSTLAGALDIREVFQRLSAVAARMIPHDEADLALLAADGTRFRLYASTHDGEPELVCPGQHCALQDPEVASVFHDGFGSNRGFQ